MNKYKKIATAVIATVMAGTMCFSGAACTPKKKGNKDDLKLALDENGRLTWSKSTAVNLNVGYNSATSGVAYSNTDNMPFTKTGESTITRATLADGNTYEKGGMKPNMKAFGDALGMTLVDKYTGKATNANLQESSKNFELYDLITANVTDIVNEAVTGSLVDLGKYLDYMPNYKHYLQSNSLIQLSVIGDTTKGSMYYTPYFDGVDDIERYVLFRHDYVSELLDHASLDADTKNGGSITYKAQAEAKSYNADAEPTQDSDASGNLLWNLKSEGTNVQTAVYKSTVEKVSTAIKNGKDENGKDIITGYKYYFKNSDGKYQEKTVAADQKSTVAYYYTLSSETTVLDKDGHVITEEKDGQQVDKKFKNIKVVVTADEVTPRMRQGKYSPTARRNDTFDGTKAAVQSYMGKTGSWTVETAAPTATPETATKVGFVKVNYEAVKTALGNSQSDLYKAIDAALPSTSTVQTASGNIVDIHNQMINDTKGTVKGIDLLKVLREYVKIVYEYSDTKDGTYVKLYGNTVNGVTTKLSDVFNSTYAAWDVDLWTAMSRCYVTCGNLLGSYQSGTHVDTLFGFVPRAEAGNRTSVTWAFIGELYGVRGLESRLGYEYIDASGNMRDARFNRSTWEAMDLFSKFQKEGLVGSYSNADTIGASATSGSCSTNSYYDGNQYHLQALSAYDYVQTQTTLGYYLDGVDMSNGNDKKLQDKQYILGSNYDTSAYIQTKDGYKWTAVMTPVSKWNVNDTSTADDISYALTYSKDQLSDNDTYMRFTESWRSVKSAGICVSKKSFDAGNDEHRSAVLGFIDYLYSNDGRIINTYGNMAKDNSISGTAEAGFTSNCGGFWYGTPVTATELGVTGDVNDMAAMAAAGVVETFDGVQYTITAKYAGKAFVFGNKLYKGFTYNGTQVPKITDACMNAFQGKTVNGYNIKGDFVGSYTSYAQQILGTCLGFAEKMQSFESQMTATMGLYGESIVGSALGNGTIKHVKMSIDEDNMWYTVSPTGLPLADSATTAIKEYVDFTNLFVASSTSYSNLYLEVAAYGFDGARITTFLANAKDDISSAQKLVDVNKKYASAFQQYYNAAWQELFDFYKNEIKK